MAYQFYSKFYSRYLYGTFYNMHWKKSAIYVKIQIPDKAMYLYKYKYKSKYCNFVCNVLIQNSTSESLQVSKSELFYSKKSIWLHGGLTAFIFTAGIIAHKSLLSSDIVLVYLCHIKPWILCSLNNTDLNQGSLNLGFNKVMKIIYKTKAVHFRVNDKVCNFNN